MTRSLLVVLGLLATLLAALLLDVQRAAAHAVLTGSSLGDGTLAPDAAAPITLQFNAGIESGLTKVVLRGAGEDRALATHAGPQASAVVVDVPALPAGAYALHYKVLAVDGHVTESVLRFKVAAR
jgi:methionine-rich copper-binding protein CopC